LEPCKTVHGIQSTRITTSKYRLITNFSEKLERLLGL